MSTAALRTVDLTKSFRGRRAVDGVTMTVARGEIVGFLGPNGAGKTTVMNMVTGLIAPDGGRIEVLGVPGGAARREIRLRIGYLQEKPRIYPEMTARDYLALFAGIYGVPLPDRRVDEVLERVGLPRAADGTLGTFSRGMQQRVCLARVMLHRPDLLILDEPTLGLDPAGVADMRDIFRQMREAGTTLLFSSHQLAEMERVCDSVLFLSAGRLIAAGRPADLLPAVETGNVVAIELYEPVRPALDALRSLDGVLSVRVADVHRAELVLGGDGPDDRRARHAALAQAITRLGLTVLSVGAATPTLEDLFLALAGPPARRHRRHGTGDEPWTSAMRESAAS
jgi:ABC-2 type transport system ATP-binding protein